MIAPLIIWIFCSHKFHAGRPDIITGFLHFQLKYQHFYVEKLDLQNSIVIVRMIKMSFSLEKYWCAFVLKSEKFSDVYLMKILNKKKTFLKLRELKLGELGE